MEAPTRPKKKPVPASASTVTLDDISTKSKTRNLSTPGSSPSSKSNRRTWSPSQFAAAEIDLEQLELSEASQGKYYDLKVVFFS